MCKLPLTDNRKLINVRILRTSKICKALGNGLRSQLHTAGDLLDALTYPGGDQLRHIRDGTG